MKLSDLVRKGAAAIQVAIAPHEVGKPAEGTTIATVIPAEPSPEAELGRQQAEAGRIITQLQRSALRVEDRQYDLDQATRRSIIQSLNKYGPPKDALVYNAQGMLCSLDGNPAPKFKAEMPTRVVASKKLRPRQDEDRIYEIFCKLDVGQSVSWRPRGARPSNANRAA